MSYRSEIGGGIVVSGLLFVGIQLLQYVYFPGTSTRLLFNIVPFALVGLAISNTGVTIFSKEEYDEHATLISAWGLGSAITFAAVFVLISFSASNQSETTLIFGIIDSASAGGLAGLLVGLYDAQSRQTLSTVETFAEKLKGLNRYGKALNESRGTHAISALCIEVAEVVLNSNGSAFLIQEGEEFEIVDTTIGGDTSRNALVEVSNRLIADQPEPLTAIEDGDGFDRIRNGEPGTTLAVRIPAGNTSALLFSVYYDIEAADQTDVDLLELLASHTSTAL